MQIKSSWGWVVVVAVTAAVGCSQSRPLVRGQTPAGVEPPANVVGGQGPIIGSAPGYGQFVHGHGDFAPGYGNNVDQIKTRHSHHDFQAYRGFQDNNFGYEGGFYAGPEGYSTEHDRTYTEAGAGGCECRRPGCRGCGLGGKMAGSFGHGPNGFPTHYQTYGYNWPQNMVYPNNQLPAGMVQYPYYTFRGPTDFFMK